MSDDRVRAISLIHEAQALIDTGRLEEALFLLQAAADADPSLPDPWIDIAGIRHLQGEQMWRGRQDKTSAVQASMVEQQANDADRRFIELATNDPDSDLADEVVFARGRLQESAARAPQIAAILAKAPPVESQEDFDLDATLAAASRQMEYNDLKTSLDQSPSGRIDWTEGGQKSSIGDVEVVESFTEVANDGSLYSRETQRFGPGSISIFESWQFWNGAEINRSRTLEETERAGGSFSYEENAVQVADGNTYQIDEETTTTTVVASSKTGSTASPAADAPHPFTNNGHTPQSALGYSGQTCWYCSECGIPRVGDDDHMWKEPCHYKPCLICGLTAGESIQREAEQGVFLHRGFRLQS